MEDSHLFTGSSRGSSRQLFGGELGCRFNVIASPFIDRSPSVLSTKRVEFGGSMAPVAELVRCFYREIRREQRTAQRLSTHLTIEGGSFEVSGWTMPLLLGNQDSLLGGRTRGFVGDS